MKLKNEKQSNSLYLLKKQIQEIKKFNYGLAILKSYLSFLVIVSHQFSKKTTKNKIILKVTKNIGYHVPCFFILSFNFMTYNLLSLDTKKILNRFVRLFVPYIGWPLIIFLFNKIYNIKLKKNLPDTYEKLKIQLIWGSGFLGQFWFQWDLIVTTFIFIIIIFIFRRNYLLVLQLLLILFYYFQYNGNYFKKNIFINKYNKYTVGRLFEMIPFGITGFTLGCYDIINKLHKFKIRTLIFSLLIYKFIEKYKVFSHISGLYYQGIKLNIKSICIIFIFSLFPSEKIENKYIKKILNLITKNSAGPFYLHLSLRDYLQDYNSDIKKGTFIGTLVNYFICYSIALCGDTVFGKTFLKYLFC